MNKRILFFGMYLLYLPLSSFSQFYEPIVREGQGVEDKNHYMEALTDEEFNETERVFFIYTLDGEYIGPSNIGIDLYTVKMTNPKSYQEPQLTVPFTIYGIGPQRDSIFVEKTLEEMRSIGRNYTVAGENVNGIYNYTSLKGHVKLLSLEEIRRKYCPKVKGPHIFMINKFFIMKNQELYKVDEDFIYYVEVVNSKDFKVLKKMKKFTIIRIFTKTHHNWHPSHMS